MSEFSGKTTHLWGVLRPDGKAVMANPSDRGSWQVDKTLDIAGFGGPPEEDCWEQGLAARAATVLTDELTERGVSKDAAAHKVVRFSIVTTVEASEVKS